MGHSEQWVEVFVAALEQERRAKLALALLEALRAGLAEEARAEEMAEIEGWRRQVRWADRDDGSLVYFVQAGAGGPIKIGHSENPKRRIADLQTASAHPLVVLGVVRGGEFFECALHQILATDRLSGEWFRATRKTVTVVHAAALREDGGPSVESLHVFAGRVLGRK